MGKFTNNLTNKLFPKILFKISVLESELSTYSQETNRLIAELITEERQRAQANKFSGVMRISDTEIATKLFNGAIMYLNPKDIAVVPHIVFESIWEAQITKAWIAILEKNREQVVLDIGANFGYFGMLAAQYLDKNKSKVYLFEANSKLIPYISKNLSVNWLNENSIIVHNAVSDKNGTATLNVLKDYTGSSSMHSIEKLDSYLSHKMNIKAEEKQIVKSVTIDTYCKDNNIKAVDLIKMDIEGYEEKAYKGMRKLVKKSSRITMFIEFTKDGYDNPEVFYNNMLSDFKNVYLINDDGTLFTPKDTSYQSVASHENDWMMIVFSKLGLEELTTD